MLLAKQISFFLITILQFTNVFLRLSK